MSRTMLSRSVGRAAVMAGMVLASSSLSPREALAHCDTLDGPVVAAARTALASGSVDHAMIWVRPQDEAEIRGALEHALAVRTLGADARHLADRFFYETVVRVHRQGEGEPYTGLKPAGTDQGPVVPAGDRALAAGDVAELEALLLHEVRDGIRTRFARAVTAKGFAPGDVAAGRAYVEAYVPLLHYVEGLYDLAARGTHPHAATRAAPATPE